MNEPGHIVNDSPGSRPVPAARPWAVVAGASEGLGEAFARELARRGWNLLLVARRPGPLENLAASLTEEFGALTVAFVLDLGLPDAAHQLAARSLPLNPGLLVYNAASAPLGDFADLDAPGLDLVAGVNVVTPLRLVHALVPGMESRGRGGIILMSSLAGIPGSPRLAAYAASKAFLRVLGQSLWKELKPRGIDVLACVAGAVRTPGYLAQSSRPAPGLLDPDQVAREALDALGRRPVHFPGLMNRLAAFLLGRLLPFRTALGIMARNTESLGTGNGHGQAPTDKEKTPP